MTDIERLHAREVVAEVEDLCRWLSNAKLEVERKFMRLALRLLEVKRGEFWTIRGFSDETEWIAHCLPHSRQHYYKLVRIAERLGHMDHDYLEDIGVAKADALARYQQHFECITGDITDKSRTMDRDSFSREVRIAISGHVEPHEEIQYRTYKFAGGAIDEVESAVRLMQQMSGSDKSPSDALNLICVDWMTGYRDDGEGLISDRNLFVLSMIGRLLKHLEAGDQTNEGLKMLVETWWDSSKKG